MDKACKYIIWLIMGLCLVMVALTINKTFMSVNSFPGIFGMISAVIAAISFVLLKHKEKRIAIVTAISIVLGLALGQLESWVEDRNRLSKEAEAISSMDNKAMPLEPYTILQGDSSQVAQSGELFANEYTILNFWAPWCPPCIKEMPLLDEFYNQVQDYDIQVIGITGHYRKKDEKDRDQYLGWVKKTYLDLVISYPIIFDEDASNAIKFKANSLPLTVLLDSQSRIIEYRIGRKGAEIVMERVRKEVIIKN